MLTKDQKELIELKYNRIIETLEYELNMSILSGTKPDLSKLRGLRDNFYSYLDSITE